MNTTNARFGSKRSTTVMVVIPRSEFTETLISLQDCQSDFEHFKCSEPLCSALSDLIQRKVVGVLGSHDVSGFTRDGLAFLAGFRWKPRCSIQVREWPGTMMSVSLVNGLTKYTVIIGVPLRKSGKHGKTREKKQTAYTCQIWGRGIE